MAIKEHAWPTNTLVHIYWVEISHCSSEKFLIKKGNPNFLGVYEFSLKLLSQDSVSISIAIAIAIAISVSVSVSELNTYEEGKEIMQIRPHTPTLLFL